MTRHQKDANTFQKSGTRRSRRTTKRPLRFENLEGRYLLAVDLVFGTIAPSGEGSPTTLNGSISGLAADNTYTLDIDWDDGSPLQQHTGTADASGNDSFSLQHTYADNGDYSIDVSLGEAPLIVGTDAVFVVDVSGSTTAVFQGDPVGDQNGEGIQNSILDAEIAAYKALNQDLINRGLGNISSVSIVAFSYGGASKLVDMDPSQQDTQPFTTPLADKDNNGVLDVEQALATLRSGGGTDFEEALQLAIDAVTFVGTDPGDGNVIFLSDGFGQGDFLDEVDSIKGTLGQNLRAFGVGTGSSLSQLLLMDPNAMQFTTTNELLEVFSGSGMSGGGSAIGSAEASVTNVAPTVEAGGNQMIDEGESISLDPATFSDPGFDNSAGGTSENFTATIAWGDGTTEPAVGITLTEMTGSEGTPTTGTVAASHTYADDGVYTVTVMVEDDDGDAGSDQFTVTVKNLAPMPSIVGPTSGPEGSPISLDGSATDPAGPYDTVSYAWEITKDGVDYTSGTGTDIDFTPDDNAEYVATLTASDEDGGSKSATHTVLVYNVAPTPSISGYTCSFQDTDVALNGSATDPAGPHDTLTYVWNVTKAGVEHASGIGNNITFTPDGAAEYVVTLTVSDEDGGSNSTTYTMTVEPELRVNSYVPNMQRTYAESRSVAMTPNGQFMVVFAGRGPDDSLGIHGRLYGADGAAYGPQFQINETIYGNQRYPSVAMWEDGRSVVVWSGRGTGDAEGVFARLYGADGSPLSGEMLVNTTTTSFQHRPVVAVTEDGFIVSWSGHGIGANPSNVYARRFADTGAPLGYEFLVNTTTVNLQHQPSIAVGQDGRFVIAWSGMGLSDMDGIHFQIFDASGTPIGSETQANTTLVGSTALPSVGLDSSGNIALVWSGYTEMDSRGVVLRHFAADGSPLSGEQLVNTTTAYDQEDASVAVASDGSFAVSWTSKYTDGDTYGVFIQGYDAEGEKIGTEVQVNTTTRGEQRYSSVAKSDAGVVVVWSGRGADDLQGVYVRRCVNHDTGPAPEAPELLATEGPIVGTVSATALTAAELNPIVEAALSFWETSGLAPQQLAALGDVQFQIADLPGAQLGLAAGQVITIDVNAAGHGWLVDTTSPAVDDGMDLMTAVMHEMGHVLGLADTHDSADEGDLMYGWLSAGTRRTPAADEMAAVFDAWE